MGQRGGFTIVEILLALLLLTFLSVYWVQNQRVPIDMELVSGEANEKFQPNSGMLSLKSCTGRIPWRHPQLYHTQR